MKIGNKVKVIKTMLVEQSGYIGMTGTVEGVDYGEILVDFGFELPLSGFTKDELKIVE
jgi:hypothetical protein